MNILRLLPIACLLPITTAKALDFDISEMLQTHNSWRATVGVPPLSYSGELAASAQRWANHLKETNQCQMRHSAADGQYGENLYWASAIEWSDGKRELQAVSPKKVVDSWASERSDFDYAHNRCATGKMCGHYTQLVWRTTTEVGCAVAVCDHTLQQIWVCQYRPAGNWTGRKPY